MIESGVVCRCRRLYFCFFVNINGEIEPYKQQSDYDYRTAASQTYRR